MIGKPTNCMGKSSSCIELIFSSNVNLTRNCGIVTLQKMSLQHYGILKCKYWVYSKVN